VKFETESATLAEFGTLLLEFRYLSRATGNSTYANLVERALTNMHLDFYGTLKLPSGPFFFNQSSEGAQKNGSTTSNSPALVGLRATKFSSANLVPLEILHDGARLSVGGLGDSYFEYLLKLGIQNPSDAVSRNFFVKFVREANEILLERDGSVHEREVNGKRIPQMAHLSCFLPGALTLARAQLPEIASLLSIDKTEEEAMEKEFFESSRRRMSTIENHSNNKATTDDSPQASIEGNDAHQVADQVETESPPYDAYFPKRAFKNLPERLLKRCFDMYRNSPSGLAPETVVLPPTQARNHSDSGFWKTTKEGAYSLLRPETAESLYYLHYFSTSEQEKETYRVMGAHIFQSMVHAGFLPFQGFLSVIDVRQGGRTLNSCPMQTFVLGETLTYLYLLFKSGRTVTGPGGEKKVEPVLSLDKWVFNTEAHPLPVFTEDHDEL